MCIASPTELELPVSIFYLAKEKNRQILKPPPQKKKRIMRENNVSSSAHKNTRRYLDLAMDLDLDKWLQTYACLYDIKFAIVVTMDTANDWYVWQNFSFPVFCKWIKIQPEKSS